MNVFTTGLVGAERVARAHSAIVLYSVRQANSLTNNEDAIATQHRIEIDEHGPRLGPGKIVTMPMVKTLLEEMHQAPLTYVPETVVALGQDSFAWYVPASVRRMYFTPRSDQDQALAVFDSKEIAQPALLFVARRGKNLSVYALREDKRPDFKTELMWAPYWNVFRDHRVCIGSMTLPKKITPAESGAWTDAFFRSNFSTAETGFYHSYKGTYAEMLTDALARNNFDPTWLKPSGVTVEKALCSN